ncbi:MAG: acyltransferase family protein [Flavobacteriaceae bacterium]|nr:acyltransferase family protein [Flavobacteriaceae bacterium]
MTEIKQKERINYLDVLRVLACFLVVLCHAGDKYVVAAGGTFHTGWMQILIFTRPCVPLFILLSGTLLLPIKYETKEFFKRRFSRILIPFLVWSILYVFFPLPGTPVFGGPGNAFTGEMNLYAYNLMMIPMNFTKSNVHFWFIYTIIGLYLFMPIVSPWIKQTTQRGMTWFLFAWGVTLFLPYIKLWFPQVWGVCDWNEFGMSLECSTTSVVT